MKLIKKLKDIGPGALVAAAFIGPGTITTATITGASYGYVLLWAVAFSIVATIILQEMVVRFSLASGEDLGASLRKEVANPIIKKVSIFLVVSAVGVGAAAYETGNILGGAMGLKVILGISPNILGAVMAGIAFILLWTGSYKIIEKVLIGLVVLMSFCFIVTAIIIKPDFSAVLAGILVPKVPDGEGYKLVLSLIGTTIVPYNLFLHSSSVLDKWQGTEDMSSARFDTIFSLILGGLITLSVVITASATFHGTGAEIKNAGQMAQQLEPLLGPWAKCFFAIGLFGAGFSSATTAPLAGAYATAGIMGWERDLNASSFKLIWSIIIAVGFIGSIMGTSPVQMIIFAQAANGVLLPISAIYLLWILNSSQLGDYPNDKVSNFLGGLVIVLIVGISLLTLYNVVAKI